MIRGLFYIPSKPISFSNSIRKRDEIKYIVVHYTGNSNDTAKGNATYFNTDNKRSAGAHFFVDNNDIYYTIPVYHPAYSVGTNNQKVTAKLFKKCTNYNSISIELCSTNGLPHNETLDNAERLIKALMYTFNIPKERVVRHYDVTGKQCPGWLGWYGENSKDWYRFKLRFSKGVIKCKY